MGNWNISIEGIGSHHNRNTPKDANRMAYKFLQELKASGHTITKATITHGSSDDLLTIDDTKHDDE